MYYVVTHIRINRKSWSETRQTAHDPVEINKAFKAQIAECIAQGYIARIETGYEDAGQKQVYGKFELF